MSRRSFGFGLAALAGVTVIVYADALRAGFVNWDDPHQLLENAAVLRFDTSVLVGAPTPGNWHPVTLLTFAVEHALFGLDPFVFHLTSVLLHVASSLLVTLVLRRLLDGAEGVALLCGALFALHPLHVESAAWIGERKDVLSTCFALASLWVYLGFARERSPGRYLACLALFGLALLSKPMAVTLPVVLLATDWRLGRGLGARVWIEKLPFFAGSIAIGVVTLQLQAPPDPESYAVYAGGLGARLGLAAKSLVFYLSKAFVPANLSVYYDAQLVRIAAWQVAVAAAALAFAGWQIARDRAGRPDLLWGAFFALVTLAPALKLVPFGFDSLYNDRYLYLPSAGLFLVYTLPLRRLPAWPRAGRAAAVVGCAVVLGVFAVQTHRRCAVWRDSERLWSDVLEKFPGTPMAHTRLGQFYLERGDVEQAESELRRALAARPDFGIAHFHLGLLHEARGEHAAADAAFARVLEARPADLQMGTAIANALRRRGDLGAAASHFERLLEVAPDFAPGWYNLGAVRSQQGRVGAARAAYERALEIDPDLAPAWEALARLALGQHNVRRALDLFEQAAARGGAVDPALLARLRAQLGE